MLRENEDKHTRYQLYRIWSDVVKSSLPVFWQDIVYPQAIKRRDSFDIGALAALITFVALVAFGVLSVAPLVIRVYNWLTSVFSGA